MAPMFCLHVIYLASSTNTSKNILSYSAVTRGREQFFVSQHTDIFHGCFQLIVWF